MTAKPKFLQSLILAAKLMCSRGGRTFVNEAKVPDETWVQLAPFGDFDNANGMQRFRAEDSKAIVNEFESLRNLPQRVMGLPFYVGHPDYPAMQDRYKDTRAYGRIRQVVTREDSSCQACQAFINRRTKVPCPNHGLFANTAWSDEGKGLIASQAFHGHSINWRMRRDGAVWRPFSMKSAGFTNEPQIPVVPVTAVNEQQTEGDCIAFFANDTHMNKLTDWIKKFLGKAPEDNSDEETLVNECEKKTTDMVNELALFKKGKEEADTAKGKADCECNAAKEKMAANETTLRNALAAAKVTVPAGQDVYAFFVNEHTTILGHLATATGKVAKLETDFGTERQTINEKVSTAETAKQKLEVSFANERKERVKIVLDGGIERGVITAADRTKWETDFANVESFDTKLAEFLKLPKKLKTTSQIDTSGLGARNSQTQDRQTKVIDAVNEVMRTQSLDYDAAFLQVKEKQPGLFAEMKKPEQQAVAGK